MSIQFIHYHTLLHYSCATLVRKLKDNYFIQWLTTHDLYVIQHRTILHNDTVVAYLLRIYKQQKMILLVPYARQLYWLYFTMHLQHLIVT